MTAFDPKLAQHAEPMLRAFSDFAIPVQFLPLSPFIPYNQEERQEQYSDRRNWKLEPASGWREN